MLAIQQTPNIHAIVTRRSELRRWPPLTLSAGRVSKDLCRQDIAVFSRAAYWNKSAIYDLHVHENQVHVRKIMGAREL